MQTTKKKKGNRSLVSRPSSVVAVVLDVYMYSIPESPDPKPRAELKTGRYV